MIVVVKAVFVIVVVMPEWTEEVMFAAAVAVAASVNSKVAIAIAAVAVAA